MARGLTSYRSPILGTTHMVSAGHYLAAAAGYRILEDGGNAIDAGVASGIAINVTLPHATNFGGVAPIAIYDAATDAVVTVSGLGRWPRAANIDYFNEHAGGQIPTGILRTVMPAAADAWLTALEKYGTMTFEHVVTPALELAENGFPVSAYLHEGLQTTEEDHEGGVAKWPSTRDVYMPDGRPPRTGELLVQADLARTFRRLIEAERGASHLGREAAIRAARDRFYRGDIAEEMAAFSEEQGGLVTLQDLAEFSVKVEPPAKGRFRDYTIYTCGPWCQGPVVAQTLQMLEDDDLAAIGHNSTEYIHLVSQALNLAYSDRHAYYGDPDHVDVPMEGLLSKGYTRSRRKDVDPSVAFPEMPAPGNPWPYQGDGRGGAPSVASAAAAGPRMQDTSYVCTVDRWGNAFSATPSDPLAGSPIVPGLGIQMSSRGSQSWLDADHPIEPPAVEAAAAHAEPGHSLQGREAVHALRHAGRRHPVHVDGAAVPQHRRARDGPPAGHRGAPVRAVELPQLLLAAHLLPGQAGPRGADRRGYGRRAGRHGPRRTYPERLVALGGRDVRNRSRPRAGHPLAPTHAGTATPWAGSEPSQTRSS